jgi:S-adenosylmethionine/arginine decarboxylase-like enzyme
MFYIYDEKDKPMLVTPWGWHLLLDCSGGDHNLITSEEHVYNFIKELVVAIDMVPYQEPLISRFATHDIDKAGISFVQMIETSHIAGHFCENNGDFYMDVFSCKDFEDDVVLEVVQKYFKPTKIRPHFVTRDA